MKKTIACLLTLCLLGAVLCFAGSGNVDKRDTVCAVQDTVGTKAGVPHVVGGKTYYLCCESCRPNIKDNPAKYTTAIDPVSGKKIDKAVAIIYNLEGKAIYFENEANRKTFSENPGKYVKK